MHPQRASLVVALVLSCTTPAAAENYRRPGLEGQWSRRHLTIPLNSMRMLVGPGQPQLMGDRIAEQNVEGGPQFVHPSSGADEWWLRFGVGFGLTKDWEAGAVFLAFQFEPEFDFSQITVFAARGFRFENWDLAIRLTFQTPRFDADDKRVWVLNPGVPILYRSDFFRFDAALFVPFATRDWSAGLTVPVRGTISVSPHVFMGLESGFAERKFDYQSDAVVPLGALAGYTVLFGGRVVDFTAMFSWDSFYAPNGDDGAAKIDVASYRVGAGFVMHTLVK